MGPLKGLPGMVDEAPFRRIIVPALGGAWCLAYLVETIRCTAVSYGDFGTPSIVT